MSCPPCGDLARYSEGPADLSGMEWHTFRAAYRRIILRAVERLREDRFACFVVADFRDQRGFYRHFVVDTAAAFEECGARLYNEAILVSPIGTAAIRATRQFNGGRKLVKTHQNVLVFCKGDPPRGGGMPACSLEASRLELPRQVRIPHGLKLQMRDSLCGRHHLEIGRHDGVEPEASLMAAARSAAHSDFLVRMVIS